MSLTRGGAARGAVGFPELAAAVIDGGEEEVVADDGQFLRTGAARGDVDVRQEGAGEERAGLEGV
jgi:hypothetical protein